VDGVQIIGGGLRSGVRGHLVGRGRRGGHNLTQGMQWWFRLGDGVGADASTDLRTMAATTGDEGQRRPSN
jgi:hypothetical protein